MAGPAAATANPTGPGSRFSGLPGYDGTPGASSPQEQGKVQAAVDRIHGLVSADQGLLGTDRNAHLHEVQGLLKQLSPAERDAVVSKLSSGDLRGLREAVDHGGLLGAQGLSQDGKTDLYNSLAGSLGGAQLTRVSASMGSPEEVEAFGHAVASFASNEAKVGYVRDMAGATTQGKQDVTHAGFGYVASEHGVPAAKAVGEVMASLKGDGRSFDAALKSLNNEQLASVVDAASGQSSMSSEGALSISYDPKSLTGMLSAAATSSDAASKARLVVAAAVPLREMNGSALNAGDAATVAGGMQRVIGSDVRGVVDQMQIRDKTGRALGAFLKAEIVSGDKGRAEVGRDLGALQRGPDGKADPVAYISAQSRNVHGEPYNRNAMNLGYFAGSARAAVVSYATDQQQQAQIIGGVFAAAVNFGAGSLSKPAGAVSGVVTSNIVMQVANQVKAGAMSLQQGFDALSYPDDPATGLPYQGPARTAFEAAASYATGQ